MGFLARIQRRLAIIAISLFAVTITVVAAIVTVSNDAVGASLLASAITSNPALVTGATFQTVPVAGFPHAVSDGLSSFPTDGGTFAILTTGDAQFADDPNTEGNTGADLRGLPARGDSDLDVTVLQIELNVPSTANCLTIDFQFYSEEFPEWVGEAYNDAFIAELDVSTWTTNDSEIIAPDNFAFDPSGDVISINSTGSTAMSAANAVGTTYDGATPLLSASTEITPGAHTLYLSIFDQADHVYDSAVFLDNLVVGFVPNPGQNCAPGAVPKLYSLSLTPETAVNPENTEHEVTATLLDNSGPVANATIAFEVTGANPTSGTGVTNAAGQATFSYVGLNAGSDQITSCYDADGDGICEAVDSAQKEWIVVNLPPQCEGAAPTISSIWPPNHKMVPAGIRGVTDPDGDPVTLRITSIRQDEPTNTIGDGNTSCDAEGVGGPAARVRAERSGSPKVPGDGRFYHIFFTADDGEGGSCSGVVKVAVPHDKNKAPVDGGPRYHSCAP
jgi:hypothetical protein